MATKRNYNEGHQGFLNKDGEHWVTHSLTVCTLTSVKLARAEDLEREGDSDYYHIFTELLKSILN